MAKPAFPFDLTLNVGAAIDTKDSGTYVRVEAGDKQWEGTWGQALGNVKSIAKAIGLPSQHGGKLQEALRSAMHRAIDGAGANGKKLGAILEGIYSCVINPSQITLLRAKIAKELAAKNKKAK